MHNIQVNGFTRISKAAAKRRFARGEKFVLCPVKLIPGGSFSSHCTIYPPTIAAWKEQAAFAEANKGQHMFENRIYETAWSMLYTEWAFYNATNEVGLYAAYYVEDEGERGK